MHISNNTWICHSYTPFFVIKQLSNNYIDAIDWHGKHRTFRIPFDECSKRLILFKLYKDIFEQEYNEIISSYTYHYLQKEFKLAEPKQVWFLDV